MICSRQFPGKRHRTYDEKHIRSRHGGGHQELILLVNGSRSPCRFLCQLFKLSVSLHHKSSQVVFDQQPVDHSPKKAHWRSPNKSIYHQRSVTIRHKLMYVFELCESTVDHLIDKQPWTFKLNDLDRHSLPHTKVSALKSNRLTEADEPLGHTRNGLLICLTRGLRMYANISNEIKTDIR